MNRIFVENTAFFSEQNTPMEVFSCTFRKGKAFTLVRSLRSTMCYLLDGDSHPELSQRIRALRHCQERQIGCMFRTLLILVGCCLKLPYRGTRRIISRKSFMTLVQPCRCFVIPHFLQI